MSSPGVEGPAPSVTDPAWVLERAQDAVTTRRTGELAELMACLDWADLHGADPADDPGPRVAGGPRLVRLGGEGTPMVRDLPLLELATALQRHEHSVRHATADALDLRHRLPRTWSSVMDLEADAWVARRVAVLSRAVPLEAVHLVDDTVARAITGTAPARLLDIAQAAVIHADPVGHRARETAKQQRRFVGLTRPDSSGLRTVVARLAAGEAVALDGLVDRVAEVLGARPLAEGQEVGDHDTLRADAMSWLGRPAELLLLLAEHDAVVDDPDAPEPERSAHEPATHRLLQEVLGRLTPDWLQRLRPRAVLYVHLHQSALQDSRVVGLARGPGVVRPEGLPPLDVLQLRALLSGHRITVAPVIDNSERQAVDAYEHPPWMRERIHLDQPADAFPHASRRGRAVDLDHPVPYNPGGPPGQTSTDSQPLSRTAHRARTHLGYRVVPTPGGVVWRTPNGLLRLVDKRGVTHCLTTDEAEVLLQGQSSLDAALERIWSQASEGSAV